MDLVEVEVNFPEGKDVKLGQGVHWIIYKNDWLSS